MRDLSVTNECSGTIDATGCLTIDLVPNTLTNDGLMEATGGGELTLLSTVGNSNIIAAYAGSTVYLDDTIFNSDCGQVIASGHCAVVDLFEATIRGGTVQSECGGLIQTVAGSHDAATTSTFDGVTIGCDSDVKVVDHTTLVLENDTTMSGGRLSIESCGVVEIANGDDTLGATLTNVTLNNCGEVTVDDGTTLALSGVTVHHGAIDGTDASGCIVASTIDVTGDSTFCDVSLSGGDLTVESAHTLTLDNTTLDDVTVTLVYDSTALIGADLQVDGTLTLNDATITGQFGIIHDGGTIDVIGSSEIDNTSLSLGQVNVESNQTLTLDNAVLDSDTVTLVSAVVGDNTVGANLQVEDTLFLVNATINGTGTIHNCGTIDVQGGGQSEIDGVTIANHGSLQLDDGAALALSGVAVHGGSIDGTDASGSIVASTIDVTGDSTFCDVNLSGGNLTVEGAILTLDDGSTVGGAGAMTIKAGGTLDVDGGTTTIDLGGTITNHGTIEASCGGALDIQSYVDNACGSLLATSGGMLDVQSCISGGTATIHAATLEFGAASNVNVTFDNGSGTDYGTLVLDDATHFTGQIYGFDGTAAGACNSDTVELTGFCETSYSVQCSGGNEILTLHDGDRCVTLTFDDFNQSFKFEVVGGNTYIYDPPAVGATDASAPATTAAGNDHVAASAHQNGTDHAAGPANEAGFGGDQSSVLTLDMNSGGDAAPMTNELAPASGAHALGGVALASAMSSAAFGGDNAVVSSAAGEADAGTLTNALHGGLAQSLLSSLLNVLTGGEQGAGAIQVSDGVTPVALVLGSKHLTDLMIVDGSGVVHDEVAPPTAPTAPTNNEHTVAPALVTSPPPAPAPASPPTLASASFGTMGNDSFAFHASLGSDTAQNTDAHTSELAHNNIQISGPALASTAPEFHQDFGFDAIHQDAVNLSAAVDQFHQMASNSTLLH